MLILNRYLGDSIMIGDEIEVKFLKMNADGSLSIGINAPRALEIHRKEIYQLMQKKKDALPANDIGITTALED